MRKKIHSDFQATLRELDTEVMKSAFPFSVLTIRIDLGSAGKNLRNPSEIRANLKGHQVNGENLSTEIIRPAISGEGGTLVRWGRLESLVAFCFGVVED